MKVTGMTRPLDKEGRVVLPVELRHMLSIKLHDPLEVFTEGRTIILRKHEPACILCSSTDRIRYYKDKKICANCLKALKKI